MSTPTLASKSQTVSMPKSVKTAEHIPGTKDLTHHFHLAVSLSIYLAASFFHTL